MQEHERGTTGSAWRTVQVLEGEDGDQVEADDEGDQDAD